VAGFVITHSRVFIRSIAHKLHTLRLRVVEVFQTTATAYFLHVLVEQRRSLSCPVIFKPAFVRDTGRFRFHGFPFNVKFLFEPFKNTLQ
jgi:hypothetical protein